MKSGRLILKTVLIFILLTAMCLNVFAATMGVVRMPSRDGSVYIRTGGSTKYPAIGYARHGDLLQILKEGKSWDKITMTSGVGKGKSGWMSNKYITNLRSLTDMSGWGALAHIKTKYAASSVCLRKGPGTSYAVKEYLHRNDLLIILRKHNSKWYEVQVAGSLRTGYVSKSYIANGASAYTTANLNLRKSAKNKAAILKVIPCGASVTVLNVGKSWSKVKYGKKTGYVWNGYVRFA